MSRSLVKICGLTRPDEACRAYELGADLLGLNFFPKSPRYVEVERAREIADCVRGQAKIVGVFVNSELAEIQRIDRQVGLDLIQFHGDEGYDMLRAYGDRAIRAIRLGEQDAIPDLESFPNVWGFLFDRGGDPRYGGTGQEWRYDRLAALTSSHRILVAGGIHPGNAKRSLTESGADGIDVCSGIEWSPGRKDSDLMQRLFEEVRDGEAPSPT
jgi:phosphoribosylanthranilate isomerase